MTEFPRGPLLYRHGLVTAHRTTSVDGSPAELWELDPGEPFPTSRYDSTSSDRALFNNFARISQTPLRCFGRFVEATETQLVLTGAPWLQLTTLLEGARVRGPIATGFMATWLRELAVDLATAPDVVLRGLAPWVLAVTVAGEPRVLDLMLARVPGKPEKLHHSYWSKTFSFMSPEQIRGLELDGRRDVWSLAVIAIELLTGSRVYQNDTTDFGLLDRICNGEGPDLSCLHDRGPALARVLEAMLSRDLTARPTPAELVSLIDRELPCWSPAQMFDEIQRLAPDEARAAIEYGY